MAVTIPNRGPGAGRATMVYELFDARVLCRLWFVAITDGDSVQLLVPTFRSEKAAHVFERCILDRPSGMMLSMDSQLELARRIEAQLDAGMVALESRMEQLCTGLASERAADRGTPGAATPSVN